MRYQWSRLNRIQKGTYGEYFAKMEFSMYGFEVYTAEVDDRGIDFVVRRERDRFYEVQVKTVTGYNLAFVNADKFKRTEGFLVALTRLHEGSPPNLFLFRGSDWNGATDLLTFNAYEGKKSPPAYEVHLTKGRDEELERFAFDRVVESLV